PGHEIVISKEPGNNDMHDSLPTVIRDAFDVARKQLQKLVSLQRKEVKSHPEQEVRAIVSRLFPDEGYGFLRTINGREIYFHKNSLLNVVFEKLEEGRGVRFFEEEGEKGPQASSVQIID
ncbi:MAG: cold-shock protein, partial [Ignavibacteria bacterium]